MSDPLVSVVIPTFDRPVYLQQAIWSVSIQTMPDWECLIVDDCSENPIEPPDDPRFRLIQRPRNGGPAAARNTGIEQSRGRYIVFLDDDDLMTPTRLHAGLSAIRRDPTALALVRLAQFDETGVASETARSRRSRVEERRYRTRFPHVGQVLVPRGQVHEFDEAMRTAEDAEWWLRTSAGRSVRVTGGVGYLLRTHHETRPGIHRETSLDNRVLIYTKHESYLRRNRRARAYAAVRIASAALVLGRRRESASWAMRSFYAYPSVRAALILRRAVLGVRATTSSD